MTPDQILSALTSADWISLKKTTGLTEEKIKAYILENKTDQGVSRSALHLATIRMFGTNSKEYERLLEVENEKAFIRRKPHA